MLSEESRRRHDELLETFRAIDSCLRAYYSGSVEIYRPLASQLRLLFCDRSRKRDGSLIARCFRCLELQPIAPIEWVPVADLPTRTDLLGSVRITGHNAHLLEVAKMPFTVTEFQNGLEIADLDLDAGKAPIPLAPWLDQCVTIHTGFLTIRDIILSVANKGGGAHVDDQPNRQLKDLKRLRPVRLGAHVLFTIAIGRFAQLLGALYAQFRDRVGYEGDLGTFEPDLNHPTFANMAIPDQTTTGGAKWRQSLLAVRNIGRRA
jgi:hypothetical protein